MRSTGNHPLYVMFVAVVVDGFSPFPSILAYFPKLSDKNLPPHWDVGQSLKPSSPTVIIDAQTGQYNSQPRYKTIAIRVSHSCL